MVVTGQQQHAALLGNPGRVAVLEHVATAIHPRPLAVPHGKHTVVTRTGEQVGLLAAPHGGSAQLLVDAGLEVDVVVLEVVPGVPQALVQVAQGRTPITGNKAGGIQAKGGITLLLQHGQAGQGLGTGEVQMARGYTVLVVQTDFGQRHGALLLFLW